MTPSLKAQKAGLAMLTAPVEVVEPTGAETHAVLKIGEQEIVGRFDPDGAPRLGELMAARDRHGPCLPVRSRNAGPHSAGRRLTFAVYPSLAGRNVFVSGGATGIGADIVRAFAAQCTRMSLSSTSSAPRARRWRRR